MVGAVERRARPPVPRSVSEPAQRFLGAPSSYSGEIGPPSDPTDLEGWQRFVDATNELLIQAFRTRLPEDAPLERREVEVGGVHTYVLRPHGVPDGAPLYLDIHGGGLVLGAGEACLTMVAPSALSRPMITWAVDYRMPPRHPYPASLDDCLAVYRAALESRDPRDIVVGGGSAGGNLAAALLLRAKDEGLPMPAALVLLTPEVDLTESGDSFRTNLGIDHVLSPLMTTNLLYANGHDLAHPYLSPLFGDVHGFPPTYLQSGTRDLFLSNTVRMHRKLRAAGVEAELHIGEAMPHGGFGGGTPEEAELAAELERFLARHVRTP